LVTWDKLYASRRVLLIDTCESGASREETRGGHPLDVNAQRERDDAAAAGLYIVAASSDSGFAKEQEGHGLFTKAILDGLDGGADANGNGVVEINELISFATSAVSEKSHGQQVPTSPRIQAQAQEPFGLARVK